MVTKVVVGLLQYESSNNLKYNKYLEVIRMHIQDSNCEKTKITYNSYKSFDEQ